MRRDMTHLCMVNAGHRPAKAIQDIVIVIYAPVMINMIYAYLNVIDTSASISKRMAGPFKLAELATFNPLKAFDTFSGSNV